MLYEAPQELPAGMSDPAGAAALAL